MLQQSVSLGALKFRPEPLDAWVSGALVYLNLITIHV